MIITAGEVLAKPVAVYRAELLGDFEAHVDGVVLSCAYNLPVFFFFFF